MNFHNINTIARYEVKLLKRSWLFRIFAILALLGISFALLVYQAPFINSYENKWPRLAVSSLPPFTSVYFYNIAQSIIVIFLAGSFLKRDKKLDTAEVIYVRPMSNADYIIGKTWGIVKVFLSLNIISLIITAFFNLLITKSPFDLTYYIFYLLTISLPSLLFVLGLSFTLMCALKNQAVTFVVMLGIIGTVFFYLSNRLFGIFDFFGVSLPAIFSDVTGHTNLMLFLLQRFAYFIIGIGLISFTIALVKRLPHKPWKIIIVYTLGGIFILIGCLSGGAYVYHYQHQLTLRNEYALTFNKYATTPNVSILTHDLTFTPKGKRMSGKSILKVSNRHPEELKQMILYLNPSLKIDGIESNGKALPFTKENQVIIISQPLQSEEEITLTLDYSGKINETICYTDILEKDYLDNSFPEAFYRFGKRYAWLEKNFVLLTPECLWYPVAVSPVHPAAPYNLQKNFVDYTLTVIGAGDKTVLSQGESKIEGDQITFTNRQPLPGISLTIADYENKTLQVDSIDYQILYFRGHDYFSKYFTLLQDTLPGVIRELKNEIEIGKGRDYPFRKFVIAETPVQFATYIRNWKGYTEYVMPEILFLPERGATLNADFAVDQHRSKAWRRHDQGAPDETEMAINNFRMFLQRNFIEENVEYGWNWNKRYVNKYNVSPMFFTHTGFIYSDKYPVIDIVLNTMQNAPVSNSIRVWGGIINDQQRANLYLEDHSFQQAISDQDLKPEIFYELLKLKSQAIRNYLNTQMPPEDLTGFLKNFYQENSFSDIPFDKFKQELENYTGVDISRFIPQWYSEDHSPSILIQDVDANQVIVEEETKYQAKFKIYNTSDVNALITAKIQQGGGMAALSGRGRRGGGGGASEQITETYMIPAGQAREIKIISDDRIAAVNINTNISKNLPSSYNFAFSKIENTTNDTLVGTFPIDPAVFNPNPNEIIIDNESSGFRTIASNKRHKLKDLFQKKDEEKYKNFMPWFPSKWTAIAADYCYGETIKSGVYKQKGSGNNSAEWTAELPKGGYYEVFFWNPKSNMMSMMRGRRHRDKEERNQTYTLQADQVNESFTYDLEQEDEGWVSMGNFYLPKGAATITLTDKVSGGYVIADAVKFTFVE